MNQVSTSGFHREDQRIFVNTFALPTLLMQAEPRQVVTANKKACALFGKGLSQIENHRGGQVFDCVNAFTEAGCGKDTNCDDCTIKSAVVKTFATGKSHFGVQTILDIQKGDEITPYALHVTTEKSGDFVVITIDKYIAKA